MLTLLTGRVVKTIFFGQLRDVEVEILYDNARYAITETCLALTIFREELTTRCVPHSWLRASSPSTDVHWSGN
jgi:E3 ubiquitin-protein ligase synoviolin